MHKLQEAAEARDIDCKRQAIPESYRIRERAAAVRQIEQELYALPARPAKDLDACEGLRLVTAANLYNEAESAAAVSYTHLCRKVPGTACSLCDRTEQDAGGNVKRDD